MLLNEEVVLGQSQRQDLTNQAIRLVDNIRRRKPPDIPPRQLDELSLG